MCGARSHRSNPHKVTQREADQRAISNERHYPRQTQTLLHHSSRLGPKESSQDGSHDTRTAPCLQEGEPGSGRGEDTTGRLATNRRQKLQQHDGQQMCRRKEAHELHHHRIGASEDGNHKPINTIPTRQRRFQHHKGYMRETKVWKRVRQGVPSQLINANTLPEAGQ